MRLFERDEMNRIASMVNDRLLGVAQRLDGAPFGEHTKEIVNQTRIDIIRMLEAHGYRPSDYRLTCFVNSSNVDSPMWALGFEWVVQTSPLREMLQTIVHER